ncbi:TonB-dependent receptor [Derxia lacustris]|uniref:TonB-dependent receptor n=1 Tax=Derxia lacustris TaxID=764842 RepID=UPI001594556B|nr:TonB-dependent receptor [Derxia lacustris]
MQAADKTPAELEAENRKYQAEIAELRQALEESRKALGQRAPAAEPAANAQAEPANAAGAAGSANGGALEAVTVRGKRSPLAALKDVPRSISVVAGEELEKQQVNNFRDILRRIGNVKWGGSSTNPTTTALSLRGVGYLGTGGALSFDASVNTTVDDVPYILSNMAVFNSYYDIETVDVARGPQGTSGGYSASLGKITFTTKKPSFVPEAEASVTIGQRNTLIAKAAIGGPVVDDVLAWRGTIYREQSNGPVENQYYNARNGGGNEVTYGNIDRTFGKLQFLLVPNADFNARLSVDITPNSKEYGISSNGGVFPRGVPEYYDSIGADGKRIRVNPDLQDSGRLTRRWFTQDPGWSYDGNYLRESNRAEHYPIANDTRGASVTLNWLLGDHKLTSISGWRDYHFDFGSPNFSNPTPFDIQRGPSSGLGYFRQKTQEFRLTSPKGGLYDYQLGFFYADVFKSSGGEGRGSKYGSDAGAYYANAQQYQRLDLDGAGRYLMANSLNRLGANSYSEKKDTTAALYGSVNWHLSEELNVNTGLRLAAERRRNDVNYNAIYDQGFAPELNPVQISNVALGGFATTAAGALASTNNATQLALADYTAKKYFGAASYSALTTAQKQQVADAKAIRAAQLSGIYGQSVAQPFSKTLYGANISPSYKFSPTDTGYFSWQHGEKAGIAQIVGTTVNGGSSVPVRPEKNDSFELGWRSQLLDNALSVNGTVFFQTIHDYISNLYFYDEARTRANNFDQIYYTTGVGNVPKVRSKGIELDIAYGGRNDNLRLSGAFNDARYVDFKFAAKPLELGGTSVPYYDVSGRRLAGVGPFSFNLFGEHWWTVFDNKRLFASANYNYTSSYLTDPSLSRFSRVDGYGLTDLGVGIGSFDRKFEVSLLVKNAFNVDYGYQPVWNLYIPGTPRWVGLTVSGKL